jgi:hypothetical protein
MIGIQAIKYIYLLAAYLYSGGWPELYGMMPVNVRL